MKKLLSRPKIIFSFLTFKTHDWSSRIFNDERDINKEYFPLFYIIISTLINEKTPLGQLTRGPTNPGLPYICTLTSPTPIFRYEYIRVWYFMPACVSVFLRLIFQLNSNQQRLKIPTEAGDSHEECYEMDEWPCKWLKNNFLFSECKQTAVRRFKPKINNDFPC